MGRRRAGVVVVFLVSAWIEGAISVIVSFGVLEQALI